MRKYGLDVATTQIYNATDQSQTWDSTGMTFRKWNDERQDYDPEMIKIINNMMVFLDGDEARMAVGKIKLPNGSEVYGINCEILMNKLTMSENLWIENNSGTYKFDDAGFIASNGTNTVKIQPQNSGEIFSIYKGNKKNFYVDASGNLHFEGDLTGATGTFSGLLSGGSINIGNGTFTVDKNGNMHASSGKVGDFTISSGELSCGNFGMFGDASQFMNISPSGKDGTLYLDSDTYIYSSWAFASTGFGVTASGNVFAHGFRSENKDGKTSIEGGKITANNIEVLKRLHFYSDAWAYGTSSGTERSKVYRVSTNESTGGDDDIPSANWVKNYVTNKIPDTSNFSKVGHTHHEYSQTGHTHGNYVTYSEFNDRIERVKQWVRDNFERS